MAYIQLVPNGMLHSTKLLTGAFFHIYYIHAYASLFLKGDLYVKYCMDFRFFPSFPPIPHFSLPLSLSLSVTHTHIYCSIFLKSFNSVCIFACCARSYAPPSARYSHSLAFHYFLYSKSQWVAIKR